MAWQKFGGSTSFTDAHDTIQGLAGNATWLNEYVPSGEDRIAEVMLWLCHSMELCCTIVGEYAMYRAGKLASRPDSLAPYIASPQTWSSEIAVLLQDQPSPTFALGGVEFELDPQWNVPGRAVRYTISHGGEEIILSISIISSDSPCGPRSNIDLTYHVWTLFDFCCTNYAIVVLPSQTSGGKIVYVGHFLAAIGETTRRCGCCVCMINDSLPLYDFGCRHPEKCPCILCCMQPPSLKAAASEIVFRMCNKEKVHLNHVSSCSTIDYYPNFDSDFEFG